ncbi:uncharacterized protein [Eurosta solidaginis]
MKAMLQLSPPVIDLICRLYDTQTDASGKNNANNPFGLGSISSNDTAGLFSKPATTAVGINNHHVSTNNTGNVFGNVTASPAVGIFTGGHTAFNQTSPASAFSQQTSKPNAIFGAGSTQSALFAQAHKNMSNIGGLFGQSPQASNGVFALQQQTQSSVNSGLFGQQQAHQSQPISGGSLFAPNQAQDGGNIFNQTQSVPNAGNVFAQGIQIQQTQNPSVFPVYQTNKQQTLSVFEQQNAEQNSSSIFGQIAATAPVTNTTNIFGQALGKLSTSGDFNSPNATSMPTQNIFAQNLQHQQTPANMFSHQAQATHQASSSFFQQNSQSSQPQHPQPQTSFGQQLLSHNSSQPLLQSSVVSSSVYSKLENLTAEEIDAFKADIFTLGKVPNVPPPRELIN